ncbi:flagellar protein FlaG [Paenibacillus polygoni]|uniref:Flagellar protein FlaG n=1 Tax=Paenibacillus polygoni TaxID=3050112 RepID=A0ABY8X079_9BACL|nr:flagellar protein FlaG [Paenibacillus polygoni]WIV18891.1 flagellar protein FlaG [Paenibacillus polygoni]
MNLQLSLSTNTICSQTTSSSQPSENAASNTNEQLINSIRRVSELARLERLGIAVSSADDQLIRSIERAAKALQGPETTLEISIHEKSNRIMVKVLNKENGELIREIPPEKTLDLVTKMMEISGMIIDEKV